MPGWNVSLVFPRFRFVTPGWLDRPHLLSSRWAFAAATLALGACTRPAPEPVLGGHLDAAPSELVDQSTAPTESAEAVPASPSVALDPTRARSLLADRDRCLRDTSCSRNEVARLTIAAADAGASTDCDLFYYGGVVPVDLARARTCYLREVEHDHCGGSSPSLARVELATMMFDGQGGPKAPPGAIRATVEGCFEDGSIDWMLAPTASTIRSTLTPPNRPIDFCNDIGGTTLSMEACADSRIDRAETDRLLIRKDLAVKLSRPALAEEGAAAAAFDAFARAASELAADDARGGTMAGLDFSSELEHLIDARNAALAALSASPAATEVDRIESARALQTALTRARAKADPDRAGLIAQPLLACQSGQRAEIGFEKEVFGSADAQKAERDAATRTNGVFRDVLAGMETDR